MDRCFCSGSRCWCPTSECSSTVEELLLQQAPRESKTGSPASTAPRETDPPLPDKRSHPYYLSQTAPPDSHRWRSANAVACSSSPPASGIFERCSTHCPALPLN